MFNLNVLKQSTLVHLCFGISYFASGIIINLLQAILYFGLKPYNKQLYRKLNYYLLYSFYSQLVFMSEWWAGCKLNIYIDKEDFKKYYGKEHGYLIMNHTYDIDWLMGWQFCDYIQVLGNCKAYAKKSIQYVPPIGWMWKFGEFVFLERSFDKDKEIISHQIAELSDYPDPIWLLLFPEGTRFTRKKHEASVAFAESKGLPVLKHHLTPRTKGFTTSLPNMRGKIPAIYNIQVAFSESQTGQPTITSLLFGAGVEAHLYIERIPLERVPEDEEGGSQWLHQLFTVKDRMQDSFVRTGDFFADSGVARIEPFHLPRRYYSLINTLGWAVLIIVPLVYRILVWLFTGEFLWFCGACLLLGAVYILMLKTIGMSQISQGSSYGAEKKRD